MHNKCFLVYCAKSWEKMWIPGYEPDIGHQNNYTGTKSAKHSNLLILAKV